MIVSQCDWCKKIKPSDGKFPPGWFAVNSADPNPVHSMFSSGMQTDGMLCSWVCLAEWASASALLERADG